MNLLPEQYIKRSQIHALSNMLTIGIIVTLCIVTVVILHSRLLLDSSTTRFFNAQAEADDALELEIDASSLESRKKILDTFFERYQKYENVFPMADLVATISNLIPDAMTLEELSLDIIKTKTGKGISGRLAGFALSDETIALIVNALSEQELFESVSMDFSRSRDVRDSRVRGFRISFYIDLSRSWEFTRTIAVAGDEE
jgi:Tfp pilus assembly protein PilN